IPTLLLKPAYADRYEIGVSEAGLAELTTLSHRFDEMVNRSPNRQAPYVGASAFTTKAGIHASAIVKDPATYEHVPPEKVGNRRHVLVSDQAGKANLVAELSRLGLAVEKGDRRLDALLREVKQRESVGYAYEAADASFELLARRVLGTVPAYFTVRQFDVNVERRINAMGEPVTVSLAVVKVKVGNDELISAAEGNGPVNALDRALRKDLGVYSEAIRDLELIDYKVRILNGGTEAVTRVLIESGDSSGASWFTVGVSANIVDASFEALNDAIIYKLLRAGAKAA
ncbi:MAG TPA: alpha-isopropylmalate synthase regulatory domain-containing protein, partial [Bauldia sp.]|nr:alpha-isopropylmalate synthase regulatory domain-containing protein [Bauldia sp.]